MGLAKKALFRKCLCGFEGGEIGQYMSLNMFSWGVTMSDLLPTRKMQGHPQTPALWRVSVLREELIRPRARQMHQI
jgi:hypothetical protein